MSASSNASIRRACHGFTLIELLVVIGIILLLVALTLTVGTGVLRQSEVRETQNTLRLLEVAVQEWELGADRQVLYGRSRTGAGNNNGEPCGPEQYELEQTVFGSGTLAAGDEQSLHTSDQLWSLLSRATTVRDVLTRINAEFLRELDPDELAGPEWVHLQDSLSYRVLDVWGNPMLAVMPGRAYADRCRDGTLANEPYVKDDDGTIRTAFENRYGVAADRRIFFVSAGPSGVFGDLHLNIASGTLTPAQQDDIKDASDNIYSYPVHIDQARPTP